MLTVTILWVLSAILESCSSSSHLVKNQSTVDSTAIKERDSTISTLNSTISEYERQMTEMENLSVSFVQSDCDTAAIRRAFVGSDCPPARVDSFIRYLAPKQVTLKKSADGSLELTGPIKSLTQSKLKIEQENASLKNIIATLISSRVVDIAHKVASVTTKEKTSSRKFLTLWWLFPLGVMTGLAIAYRKKIIQLFNPKTSSMKSLLLFALCSILIMSCDGNSHVPMHNVPWGDAWLHVAHSFSYWLFTIITFLVLVVVTYKSIVEYKSGDLESESLALRMIIVIAAFAFALLFRPCEVAVNTTVEQAARGVWLGY
jgi:hypothetical protein